MEREVGASSAGSPGDARLDARAGGIAGSRQRSAPRLRCAETLENADAILEATHALVDPRGHNAMQLQRTLDDFAAASARLRNLAERVDRDPIASWCAGDSP